MTARPLTTPAPPALPPELERIITALARADARRDYAARSPGAPAPKA